MLYSSRTTESPVAPELWMEISDCVTRMLHAIDVLDWAGVRSAFSERVRIDYTSLFGGEANTLASDDLIASWRGLLPGFDATQHLIGPVVCVRENGGLRAETHVRGYHYQKGANGGDTWMVAGHYTFQFLKGATGWKIAAMTLTAFYQEGNLSLPALAKERATVRPRVLTGGGGN